MRRCGKELTKSRVVLAPTCRSKPLVGARFMRHTHSFASISAPYSRRLRMPALETTAHVAQRSGLLCAVSGTEASSRFSLVGLGLGLELG